MLATSLIIAYLCLIVPLQFLFLAGRITAVQYSGVMAILSAASTVVCAVAGWTGAGSFSAAATALHTWNWWHGGGGDGTKRRLRSWARRFQGVRRTAPQGA